MVIRSARPPADAASQDQHIVRGLTFIVIATLLLPTQDAAAKFLSGTMSPGQITWARFFFQVVLTLPFLLVLQGWRGLIPNRLWPNVLRGALVAVASASYFVSLKFMPLADALAVMFIQPFILTILSALIDKEHVGWRRRIAVTAGFVGVLFVVQPSWAVFGPVSLLPMASGVLFAFYVLLNRRMARHDTALTMQFTAGVSALLVMTLILAGGWLLDVPDLTPSAIGGGAALFLLLLMGMFGTAGHLFLVFGGRLAPSSLVAPMQYVEIVFAVLLGYVVFGDFPGPVKWVGIAIIVGAGVYVFWREARVR